MSWLDVSAVIAGTWLICRVLGWLDDARRRREMDRFLRAHPSLRTRSPR